MTTHSTISTRLCHIQSTPQFSKTTAWCVSRKARVSTWSNRDERAATGSLARNLSRSSASSSAVAYRSSDGFCRQRRAIISRSASTPRIEQPRGQRILFEHLQHGVDGRGRLKRRPTGERGVEQGAEPVDVGRAADLAAVAGRLLGSHVTGRADDRPAVCEQRASLLVSVGLVDGHPLGQAEIAHERVARAINENVRGFEVAVQQALAVCFADRATHGQQQLGRLARGERPLGNPAGERRSLDELHAEEGLPLVIADFIDGRHVRMVQPGCRLSLAAKPRQVGRGGQFAAKDHLERDDPSQADLPRREDDPHTAATDLFENLVIAERAAGARTSAADSVRSRRARLNRAPATRWQNPRPPWPSPKACGLRRRGPDADEPALRNRDSCHSAPGRSLRRAGERSTRPDHRDRPCSNRRGSNWARFRKARSLSCASNGRPDHSVRDSGDPQ